MAVVPSVRISCCSPKKMKNKKPNNDAPLRRRLCTGKQVLMNI